MKITLVRHAEVNEKYKNCYNGHNGIGLSEKGSKQAKELTDKLNSLEFDAIFCSDLPRAKETIQYLSNIEDVIYTDRLREKSWGEHEGLSFDEIVAQSKIEYTDFLQWISALGGEPYEEYLKRIEVFFIDYLPSLNKENILIITHAGVIRSLISIVQNISLEEAFGKKIKHASCIIYNTKNGDFIDEDI